MTEVRDHPIPADEVRARIEDIIERSSYETTPSMLDKLLEWILDHLGFAEGAATAIEWVLGVLAIALVVLLLWLVVRLIRNVRRQTQDDRSGTERVGPSARERATLLRREARAARRDGDLRLALRLMLFALVVGLGARGNLRYRDAWTNRELLERGRPSKATHELLFPLVREFEAKDFGREPTSEEDLDRLDELCATHLGTLRGEEA